MWQLSGAERDPLRRPGSGTAKKGLVPARPTILVFAPHGFALCTRAGSLISVGEPLTRLP
jgi:hypothetical protein